METTGGRALERRSTTVTVRAWRDGAVVAREERLAGEEPLAIRVAGPGAAPSELAITMRTPGGEDELAAGLLLAEGLIADADEILGFERPDPATHAQPDDEVTVRLRSPFDPGRIARRTFAASAACGICGRASIDELVVRCDPTPDGPVLDPAVLLALPRRLREHQKVFAATGGLHAAGLFEPAGAILALREDVGRHNALDKLIGSRLLAGERRLHARIVLLSGRAGFELVQKAAVAGVPVLAAVSAPSDLAVEAAGRLGVTLVGFLRDGSFNVYANPGRIAGFGDPSGRDGSRRGQGPRR